MKEKATINQFLVRAIGHAKAIAIDAEFSLRIKDVRTTPTGKIRIEFDKGRIVVIEQSIAP